MALGATRMAPTAMAAFRRARRWMLVMGFSFTLRGVGPGLPGCGGRASCLHWAPAAATPSRHSISGLDSGPGAGSRDREHVGKTDEQLLQRIKDEQRANGKYDILTSSSFRDLDSAQKYTQYNVRQNIR
ncbi:RNase A-like domain-containing protein [Streptomyces sp. NPDC091273]|uniref:RNase A-like domain-containing protein n=1 Tax=Streptomyces sp. NPDC091273 TaxID=3365982 RepID=UPI0037F7C9D2